MPKGIYLRTKKRGGWKLSQEAKAKISIIKKGNQFAKGWRKPTKQRKTVSHVEYEKRKRKMTFFYVRIVIGLKDMKIMRLEVEKIKLYNMKYKKDSSKKSKQGKDKCSEKKIVDGIFSIHKAKGSGDMLRVWKESDGIGLSRFAFHPEERWWSNFILSRDECEWLLLSLQHQLRRQPMGVRSKTGANKSGGIIQVKRTDIKGNSRVVRRKNKILLNGPSWKASLN